MSTTELRRKIKKQVDSLASERLPFASELLLLLKRQEEKDAAMEREGFRSRITKAERDVKAGRAVSVENLKRKY
jgi:hypothetical protein